MRRPTAVACAVVLATAGSAVAVPAAGGTADGPAAASVALLPARLAMGTSVVGRPLVAERLGRADAPRTVLVLGQMHGSEPAGRRVVAALRGARIPVGVQVWVVSTLNPDGAAAGTRRNRRGVDLNRNFPYGWRRDYTAPSYYPGRSAASEPETRAFMSLVERVRPDAVVSFHQAFNAVDASSPKTGAWARFLAAQIGLPVATVSCRGRCAGTMTSWVNARYPGWALTVELPGRVPDSMVRRAAAAVLRVGVRLAPHAAPTPSASPTAGPTPGPGPSAPPVPTLVPGPAPSP